MCVQNRECLLGEIVDGQMMMNEAGRVVQTVWHGLPGRFSPMAVDEFVVMPNHVHGIIVLVGAGLALPNQDGPKGAASSAPTLGSHGRKGAASSAPTLGDVVRAFKSISAIHVNRLLMRAGRPLWQRNYFEHVIRDEDELNHLREYVANNPLQWALDLENPSWAPGEGAHACPNRQDEPWRR
jgi:REP element-mobilizing transposase RayT